MFCSVRRDEDIIMNGECVRFWNEAVKMCIEVLSNICYKDWRKIRDARIADGSVAYILLWREYFAKTNWQRCFYTNPLSGTWRKLNFTYFQYFIRQLCRDSKAVSELSLICLHCQIILSFNAFYLPVILKGIEHCLIFLLIHNLKAYKFSVYVYEWMIDILLKCI